MGIIELIAVSFSLISVLLTIKNNVLCWSFGIIGILFYLILFYKNDIFGNMFLQFIFIFQSLIGWINWNKPNKYPITWMSNRNAIYTFIVSILLLFIVSSFLLNMSSNMIVMDSITTTLSIVGMILLAYRKIDSWLYWILADIIFIVMFIESELYLSSIIYSMFLILSVIGLFKWIKISKEKN